MNTTLDQELRDYHRQFSDDHSGLRAELAARLDGLAPEPAPASCGRRWKWRSLSLATTAALLLVVLGAWLLSPRDLCAKVLDALKSASTIHCKGTRYDADGKKIGRAEVWYDRQRGVREELEWDGRKRFRLDDGTHEWQAETGTGFATRSESHDPLGLVRKALNPEKAIRHAVRRPELDAHIDGVPCQCYQSESPGRPSRYRIWIDGQFRGRRFVEENRRGDTWIREEVQEAQYDVPIDAKRFVPDFVQGVRVLTSDDSYDNRFDLKGALATKEVMGNVLAVHDLQRISDRLLFIVYSIRPSEETERRLGKGQGYGDFTPSVWRRIDDKRELGMQDWPLGYYASENRNVQVVWSVIILLGDWDLPLKGFDVTGYVHTRNELQRELEQLGKPSWHRYNYTEPLMRLPMPDRRHSLQEVTARIYEDMVRLTPLASKKAQVQLRFGFGPLTEEGVQEMIRLGVSEREARRLSRVLVSTPRRISLEGYQAAVKVLIKKHWSP